MPKQTEQQKLKQIKTDINRLSIKDQKTKDLVQETLEKLNSYTQGTGPLVARRIKALNTTKPSEGEIKKIVEEGNKFETIQTILNGGLLKKVQYDLMSENKEILLTKYPKLFAAITKILPTQNMMDAYLQILGSLLPNTIMGNIEKFCNIDGKEVVNDLEKHQDVALKKTNTREYLIYYKNVALPALCIKYAQDIQKKLGLDIEKMKKEEAAKVEETKRKIKEEKMKK